MTGLSPATAPSSLDELTRRALRGELGPDPAGHAVSVGFVTSQGARHARVRAVRAAAPDVRLLLDPNGAWTTAIAIEVLTDLAELGIEAVEQLVAPGTPAELATVAAATGLPVSPTRTPRPWPTCRHCRPESPRSTSSSQSAAGSTPHSGWSQRPRTPGWT